MAFTIHFEQDKVNSKGLTPILARVTINRAHWRINTNIRIKPNSWNKDREEVRRSEPDYAKYNDGINNIKRTLQALYIDLQQKENVVSLKKLRSSYERGHSTVDFVEFIENHISNMIKRGSQNTSKQYSDFLVKFNNFAKKKHFNRITMNDINVDVVMQFENYVRDLPSQRTKNENQKLHPNTVRRILRVFRTIMNDAVRERVIDVNDNPFIRYKMPSEIRTSKEQLTPDEIKAIENAPIPKTSKLRHYRNAFLFSYYNAGIRIEDICLMRMSNIEHTNEGYRLTYVMKKVSKPYSSKQTSGAIRILEEYWSNENPKDDFLFPFLSQYSCLPKFSSIEEIYCLSPENQSLITKKIESQECLINAGLKDIARIAGIEKKLSFHVSRHSFARNAHLKGATTDELQVALNHSDPKVTQHYIGDLGFNMMDDLTNKVFGDSNKEKLLRAISSYDDKCLTDKKTKAILAMLKD